MTDGIQDYMRTLGRTARAAARAMARAETGAKNAALNAIAERLTEQRQRIFEANRTDLAAAQEDQLAAALLDRLELTPARLDAMADGLAQVAGLADPIGEISGMNYRPTGIQVGRMRVPLGVVGIIYESRPNVTADAAALCIKSGNAVILRGGSEAINSNRAIAECIGEGLQNAGLPGSAVQVVATTDRAAVGEMLALEEYIDVIIPRGGKGLIERVSQQARMPVIKHLDGVCHVYADSHADTDKAVTIAYNAKTQRYGTCCTMECLLVAEPRAAEILARLGPMLQEAGVEIRGDERAREILPDISSATDDDYFTEYLAPVMSLKIVSGLDEALEHIEHYGSRHTDAIVTENVSHARRFLAEVDSSSVMVNASTRFADGYEYGLGAEIGISTDKFHARGPVGLEGLTSQKFIVIGDGHTRK